MRKRLASLSFSEKVKILEKLRDRNQAIAASGLRRKSATLDKKVDRGAKVRAPGKLRCPRRHPCKQNKKLTTGVNHADPLGQIYR